MTMVKLYNYIRLIYFKDVFTYWYINKVVSDFELWKTDELNSKGCILPTICHTLYSIFTQS